METKRDEYSRAGIGEYWIVDPQTATITVLVGAGSTYREHGVFQRGEFASSHALAGFSASVDAVLAAAG